MLHTGQDSQARTLHWLKQVTCSRPCPYHLLKKRTGSTDPKVVSCTAKEAN